MGEDGKTIYCPVCNSGNASQSTACVKCGADLSGIETLPLSHEPFPQKIPSTSQKANMEFVHGQDFGTRYRIIEEIGRGGMGRVYKAFDKELNRVVALKMIHPERCTHPEAVNRFKKELLLAQEVTHENVIRIHDIGEADGIKYISMPFIEGFTLKNFIQASKKVSIATAIDIIQQICNGLQAAHKKGILHRDLKTRNIMVDHKGQVYILDFGIARSLLTDESSSLDGRIIGTPEYMSPEQAQAKPADQRSDIYSLGIIMYELMTGKVPFTGDNTSDLILQQISTAPKNPKELNPDIPQFMEKIILKCLEKDPANRYQSIQEISNALLQATIPVKAIKSKSALPRWLWGIAAILIIGICISLYFIYFREAPHPSAPPVQTKTIPSPEPSAPASTKWKNSIAVLPFKNISSEQNQDYFCDGMTEQLISNLANLKDLKVIARTSIMAYKNTTKDIRIIAKELNVGNVLEGSVRKSGNQVRITAQLINAVDGSHLWAQNYDRALKDIFRLQDEVSQKIAESLHVVVGNQIIDTAQKTQPQNIEAYNYYLKAKYAFSNKYLASFAENDLMEAQRFAEKSIEIDPEYALGYTILAGIYIAKCEWGKQEDYCPKAEHYANLAYKLAPNLPESLRAMQLALFYAKKDVDQSFKFLKKLIEDNPNDFDNNYLLETFYSQIGMPEDGIKYATRAIELNPLNWEIYGDRASHYNMIGDNENSIRDTRSCLSLKPESIGCKSILVKYLLQINDLQNADKYITEMERSVNAEKSPQILYNSAKYLRALYFAKPGKKDQAIAIAKGFNVKGTKILSIFIYGELGMAHEAVQILQEILKGCKDCWNYYELSHYARFDHIRNDPEFQNLIIQQKPLWDEIVRKYRIK